MGATASICACACGNEGEKSSNITIESLRTQIRRSITTIHEDTVFSIPQPHRRFSVYPVVDDSPSDDVHRGFDTDSPICIALEGLKNIQEEVLIEI